MSLCTAGEPNEVSSYPPTTAVKPLEYPVEYRGLEQNLKNTFLWCSGECHSSVFGQNMPPGPLEMWEKTNLLGAPYFYMACQICDLFRLASFSHFHSDLLKTHLSQLRKVLETKQHQKGITPKHFGLVGTPSSTI